MQIVGRIGQICISAVNSSFGVCHIGLGLIDRRGGALETGLRAKRTGLGHIHTADFAGNDAALVAYLALKSLLIGLSVASA
jgi:hypothetical protein